MNEREIGLCFVVVATAIGLAYHIVQENPKKKHVYMLLSAWLIGVSAVAVISHYWQ